MSLKMNDHGEFVDDFDPYGYERKGAYADVLGHIGNDVFKIAECPICGRSFKRSGTQVYCSAKCRKLSRRLQHGRQATDLPDVRAGFQQEEL